VVARLRGKERSNSEAGDTLVELLVSIVVIGLTSIALLGTFATTITASTEHRTLASSDSLLKSFVEYATYQIQMQGGNFSTSCTPYTLSPPYTIPAGYTGYTVGFTGSVLSADGSPCVPGSTAPQRLTAQVQSPSGATQHIDFVVADPSASAPLITTILTSVVPNFGTAAGGDVVTINGSGFTNVTGVNFGGLPATNVNVVSPTQITVKTPADTLTLDPVPVTVSTTQGTTSPNPLIQFNYGPNITGLNPTSGHGGGLNTVVISGTGFTGISSVSFGSAVVPTSNYSVDSPQQITVTSVPSGSGTVNVVVTNGVGPSPSPVLADKYTYTGTSQTITFTSANPSPVRVGGPTYTPTATATSGLPVSISLDNTSTGCSLAGGVVTFTAAGTCKVDANQAGNATYSPAPQVQQSISVFIFTQSQPTTGGNSGHTTFLGTASSTTSVTVDYCTTTISSCTPTSPTFVGSAPATPSGGNWSTGVVNLNHGTAYTATAYQGSLASNTVFVTP
jgi:hypothetical protein